MLWILKFLKIKFFGMALSALSLGGNPGTVFRDINIKDAIYDANAESKYIMLYFYSDWCEPCQWMEKNCLNKPEITTLINKKFIPLKVDLDELSGFELRRKYEVKIIPTVIILDSDGQVVDRVEETLNVKKMKDFIALVHNKLENNNYDIKIHKANTSPVKHIFKVQQDVGESAKPTVSDTGKILELEPNQSTILKQKYYLQFGLFSNKENADKKNQQLRSLYGIECRMLPEANGKFRLVGFATDDEDALYELKHKIQEEYHLECFVVCL